MKPIFLMCALGGVGASFFTDGSEALGLVCAGVACAFIWLGLMIESWPAKKHRPRIIVYAR